MKVDQWKQRIPVARLLAIVSITALSACGGGGGGGDAGGNTGPIVDAGASQDALARKTVSLEAAASDADGSIASFAWVQTAGTDVTLSASDDNFAEFTAPDIDVQETLSFSVTVTDNDGATATDSVDVVVTPAVTLSAKVYDGPLAGATVTVTVGDKTYTAVANAAGEFVLDIGSPDPGAMITIVATGGAGQENAELVSIAGTFGALAAAAGDDGTLEPTESGAVDVTNISTAKAVLMIQANGGEAPADDVALADLEKSVDTDAMLELATVIKLVIDEGIELPEGLDSTYDMAGSDASVDAVIVAANAADPALFQATLDAILSDPNLMPSFQAGEVPNLYFVNRAGHYIYANRGYFLELEEGGTGHVYGNGSSLTAAITWTLADGALNIAIDDADPLVQHLSCALESGERETCVQSTTDITVRMISDGAQTDAITVTHTGTLNYVVTDALDTTFSNTYNRLGMAPGGLKKFAVADVEGTWSVPLSTLNDLGVGAEYETGLLTFNADGTGLRNSDAVAFQWSIDESGVLSIAFAGGDQLDVYWLRDEGDMAIDAMFVMNTALGDTFAVPTLAAEVDPDFEVLETDADGTWHYFDNEDLLYVLDSASDTAIARYVDGAGATVVEYPAQFLFDGTAFEVISWWDIENQVDVANCTGVTTCQNYYSSQWLPLSADESGRIFILEVDNGWDYDPASPGTDYRGPLNYHHAQNRWLAPASTGTSGMAKTSAPTNMAVRGDLVRELMSNEAPVGEHTGR